MSSYDHGRGPASLQDRLDAIELQCRWADAVDRRLWPVVLACFTDDASSDLPRTGVNSDIRRMVAAASEVVERLDVTQHHLSNHIVDQAPHGLDVQCYVMAQHVRAVEGRLVTYTFGGRYTDQIVRVEGCSRIRRRRLEIIWSSGDASILHA